MGSRHCSEVVRLLVEFLERQLPPDVHTDLQRHLAACPRCLTQLRTYRCTVSLLRSIKEEDLPEELRWTLQAFLDKKCNN
jgi:anti-sigma factor (TIGR02949 family)